MEEETPPDHCNSSEERSISITRDADASVQTDWSSSSISFSNENPKESESGNIDLNSSSDALAKGLSAMLATVMKDFDARAQNTLKSQDQLGNAIDRLTRELDQLLEDAPLPFIMQHAAKISGVRNRVLSLNSLLKSIQRRIDNIDRMLTVGVQHGI